MTLLGWMLYVTLVGAFLSLAAWLVEQGASRYRLPLRWIWVGALALGVLIPVWGVLAPAPVGAGGDIGPVEGAAWVGSMGSTEGGVAPEPVGPVAWGQGIVLAVNRALQGASDAVGGRAEVNALLGWGWGAASAFFLTLLLAGAVRLRRRSRRWIPVRLGEREVLIAPTTGPAVVGLVQPRIVIPARYRELAADEVNLILEHETEHIRARDPVLLAVSLIPLILAPWNPSFWWSFHRLRAAMEVDCDGRVLAGGARPARYGGLLLQMGCSGSRQTLPALSLAGTPSTLERRLNAMNDSSTRNALPVSIICGVLAV
ncbi:MAG: M56 family metallopeptidase, partial [Gemmatimonadales bacterium]